MEDTLRELADFNEENGVTRGLNPCFNGRYSQRCLKAAKAAFEGSLNPCFNGRYSQRLLKFCSYSDIES